MNSTIPKIDYKIIVNQNDPSFEDEAKKFNYPVRCFYFKRTKAEVFHNDNMRVVNQKHKHLSKKAVPELILVMLKYWDSC